MENEKNEDLSNIEQNEATEPKQTDEEKETIEATYRAMGRRSAAKIAEHILKENIHEDNLINDIANVDYTKGHQGKTHLQEIEGFGLFVDDLYIYGYLGREDIAYNPTGGISCTQGANGSACCIVEMLRSLVRQTIGKNSNLPHINIMHTVEIGNQTNSSILNTIAQIEKKQPIRKKWEERTLRQAFGVFVAKVDVSNIPIQELQKYTPELEKSLFANGYYVYCVDYTRDFSGTMDKKELIAYLREDGNFRMEGETSDIDHENIILNNSSSVGKNVLTYLRKDGDQIRRVKFYNKIVSNLEAGEVRQSFGGHLYDYVYSSNERLRRLFWHPDAKSRGITRLEVSLYGKQYRLSENIGGFLISRELKLMSKSKPLFYIQPAANQWQALAEKIGQCFVLVDRPNHTLYFAWYGNSLTGRIAGVRIDYAKKKDKENIENLVLWAISDFGFCKVPIHRMDILEYTTDRVRMSPLKVYVKGSNTKTILTPCNKPGKFTKDVLDIEISDYLPPTEFINWEWRTQKLASANDRKPTGEILEMPQLAKNKKVSLLSLTEREKRNLELAEAKNKTEWLHKTEKILKEKIETIRFICAKLEDLENRKQKEEEAFNLVRGLFRDYQAQKIQEKDTGKYYILGWTSSKYSNMVLLLDTTNKEKYHVVFANTKIERILKYFKSYFLQREIYKNKPVYFYKPIYDNYESYFILEIRPKDKFFKNGSWLEYFPVWIDPREEKLKVEIEKFEREEEELNEKTQNLYLEEMEPPEKAKDSNKCADIDEGEYRILSYSRSLFRGKTKTFIYIEKTDHQGSPFLVWGHWIEEEFKRIEDLDKVPHPVLCRLGMVRTTPNKKKARTCDISYNKL